MPPGRRARSSSAAGAAEDVRSIRDWLDEVGDGGVLQQYHDAISNSYTSAGEVSNAHRPRVAGGAPPPLDDFFAQAGVKKAGHRRLFQHWFAKLQCVVAQTETRVEVEQLPPEDAGQLVRAWLEQVDESGALQQYAEQVSAVCSGGEDVLRRYVEIGADGCRSLSERFFDDSGVRKKGHQRLFRQWLAKSSSDVPAEGAKEVVPVSSACSQAEQGAAGQNKLADTSGAQGETCSTTPNGLSGTELEDLASWLTSLDDGGTLQQYCDGILRCCTSVEGLKRKYLSVQSGCKPVLNISFFEDSGIKKKGHQRLFVRWAEELDIGKNAAEISATSRAASLPSPTRCSEMAAEAARLPQEIVEAFMADPSAQMYEVVADGDEKGLEVFLTLCEMKSVDWQKMRDEDGQNLLEVAHASKLSSVARVLVRRGAREPLFALIPHSDVGAAEVAELIRLGAPADAHAAAAAAKLEPGPRRTELLAVLGDKDKAGEWLSEALAGTSREWVSALTAAQAYGTKMRVV